MWAGAAERYMNYVRGLLILLSLCMFPIGAFLIHPGLGVITTAFVMIYIAWEM